MFWRSLFSMVGIFALNNIEANIPHFALSNIEANVPYSGKNTLKRLGRVMNKNQKRKVGFIILMVDSISLSSVKSKMIFPLYST